jgi:hypothetical protein
MNKQSIKGAILIFSCHKHLENRLNNPLFGLKSKEYNGWKVFYFIGNPCLDEKYQLNGNLFTLKCEDSYIHVLKKVVMALEIIFELYNIEEGILRCGDDLIFNEKNLLKFIHQQNKHDYIGKLVTPLNSSVEKKIDYFIPNYFINRQNELFYPLNGLKDKTIDDIIKYNEVPNVKYAGGVIFYLSKQSCEILIQSMKSINWDIFKYYDRYGYPYIIEDIGVGFILNAYGINPIHVDLYSDYEVSFENTDPIGCHTNHSK